MSKSRAAALTVSILNFVMFLAPFHANDHGPLQMLLPWSNFAVGSVLLFISLVSRNPKK